MKIRTFVTRSILAAAVITSVGFGAQAFAEAPAEEPSEVARLEKSAQRLDRRMQRVTKKLALTPEQATKVRSIMETRQASVRDAIARAGGDRKAAKAEIKSIRKSSRAEIKAVLSADQLATFKSMKKRGKKRGKKGRRAGRRMVKSLNLTPEQKVSFKAIRKQARTERRAIIANANGDRAAAKPALKALRFETSEKISKLLTPEQRTTYQKFRAERREARKARKAARGAEETP